MKTPFVTGVLCIHALLLGWIAWRYSPTLDEPAHLISGLSHWKYARFDLYRVNAPLVPMQASIPLLFSDPKLDLTTGDASPYARPEFSIAAAFVQSSGVDVFWYLTIARWACIPLSLIGGWYCYQWSKELYGSGSGIVALVLWCFCPNILGNGALITPDVGAAALGVAAAYYFWRWLICAGMDGCPGGRFNPRAGGTHKIDLDRSIRPVALNLDYYAKGKQGHA